MRRQLPVFWIVVGLLVIAGLVALVVTSSDDSSNAAKRAGKKAPVYADVEVAGTKLASFPGNDAKDPAIGEALPAISGTGLDGKSMTISGNDGAQIIVAVAHWCPHCQAEIPRIAKWMRDGGLPKGVTVRTISTSVGDSQPNFPPAEWLAREKWKPRTLADDELGSAATAIGLEGFPYIMFVGADGTIAKRYSGEMPIDELETEAKQLVAS